MIAYDLRILSRSVFDNFVWLKISIRVDLLTSLCSATTVRLPSGWRRNTWLPFCLTGANPILASALIISFPDRFGSFSDNY